MFHIREPIYSHQSCLNKERVRGTRSSQLVHWPGKDLFKWYRDQLESNSDLQRSERDARANRRNQEKEERELLTTEMSDEEKLVEKEDEKKSKKDDSSSLMEQFNRLSIQNKILMAELEKIKQKLAEQQRGNVTTAGGDREIAQATKHDSADDGNLPTHTAKTLVAKRISHLLSFEPITCNIEQDISDWIERFEDKCDRLSLTEEQRFSVVQDLLQDGAKMWFDTHRPIILNWTLFKEKIMAHFELVMGIDSFARYKQLYNRRRAENESAVDYFYNMIRLCRKADSNMDEGTKIKHLLEGLSLREKSYVEVRKPESTERFLQILIDCDKVILEETARQHRLNRQAVRPTVHRSNPNETSASTTAPSTNRVPDQNRNSGCWSCGSMEHYRQNCPKNC